MNFEEVKKIINEIDELDIGRRMQCDSLLLETILQTSVISRIFDVNKDMYPALWDKIKDTADDILTILQSVMVQATHKAILDIILNEKKINIQLEENNTSIKPEQVSSIPEINMALSSEFDSFNEPEKILVIIFINMSKCDDNSSIDYQSYLFKYCNNDTIVSAIKNKKISIAQSMNALDSLIDDENPDTNDIIVLDKFFKLAFNIDILKILQFVQALS